MLRLSLVLILFLLPTLTIISSEIAKGAHPILQRTIHALFSDRSQNVYPGPCKWIRSSTRQTQICKRNPGLDDIIQAAKVQAITACEEAFKFDRWNCSLLLNNKVKRNIFNKVYRETAFVYALISASLSHAIAKACASGDLERCSCATDFGNDSTEWTNAGCGDDFRFGKRTTRNFLDVKHAGTDQIAEVLKQDVIVGVEAIGHQLREVCKCHGFSGSCTTKTCWKRLSPFTSAMGLLKKHYHHAAKKKLLNYTTKRAITPRIRKKIKVDRKSLVYLQKTPNLCLNTKGRVCKDRQNCATLCCGRGYNKFEKQVESRCNCKMVNCCYVKCDTCKENVDVLVCK